MSMIFCVTKVKDAFTFFELLLDILFFPGKCQNVHSKWRQREENVVLYLANYTHVGLLRAIGEIAKTNPKRRKQNTKPQTSQTLEEYHLTC